jgi:hypothetical protein
MAVVACAAMVDPSPGGHVFYFARGDLARLRGNAEYRAMDQVSRPMLIALAATIALAAIWLVALRPKPADLAGTPAAPVTAIASAKDATTVSDGANAKVQDATAGDQATTPAAGKPAAAAAGATAKATPAKAAAPAKAATPTIKPAIEAANEREAPVVRDIRRGKVVVMLFWSAAGADDIATRGVVRDLSRHHGKVAVYVVPLSRVGQYESITKGVTISQSPTTLVIDRHRRVRSIVGLTELGELTQAVDDALLNR